MLEIFGVSLKLVQSTSPVPGKLAASVVQVNGKVWADLFLWDPLSKVLQFDEDAFSQLLVSAKKAEGGWVSIVLSITDFVIRIVNGLRGLFGGSYGGSLGFGQVGALVATASALAFIVATVAAAVVVIPLSCMAWALRLHINAQIRREREKVAAQVFRDRNPCIPSDLKKHLQERSSENPCFLVLRGAHSIGCSRCP